VTSLTHASHEIVPFQIVHHIPGRIRLQIPRLGFDVDYGTRLHYLTYTSGFVTEARLNLAAKSLVVHYADAIVLPDLCDRLRTLIQQALTVHLPPLAVQPVQPSERSPEFSNNLRGMGWMIAATVSFAGMQAAIRLVAGGIHPFQIAFVSNLLGIAVLSPWLLNDLDALHTEQFELHGIKALVDTAATLLLFTGISLTPLAQANALGFTAPLFAMIGAVLFLGEAMQSHKWVALILGIIGTVVLLRPGVEIVGLGAILILSGTVALAVVLLMLKVLAKTDSSLTSNLYTVLLLTPLTLIPALWVWQVPTVLELLLLGTISLLMVGGQMAVAEALRVGDATAILPVDFAQLIWASSLGYLLFAEVPDLWVWVGGILIFAGSLYAAYAESTEQPNANPQSAA